MPVTKDEFEGGNVVIDNTAKDEFEGGNVIIGDSLKKKKDTKPSVMIPSTPSVFKSESKSEGGTSAAEAYGVATKPTSPLKTGLKDFIDKDYNTQQDALLLKKKMFDSLAKKKETLTLADESKSTLLSLQPKLDTKKKEIEQANRNVISAQDSQSQQLALEEKARLEQEHDAIAKEFNSVNDKYNIYNKALVQREKLDNALNRQMETVPSGAKNTSSATIFGKSLYNATLPAMVKSIGQTINVLGEVPEMLGGNEMPEGMKPTDKIGDMLYGIGEAIRAEVPAEAETDIWESPTVENVSATAGSLIGNLINVIGTGAIGGTAAAFATGMSMGIDESFSAAKQAGLNDKDAAKIALPVGLINGVLDVAGVDDILKGFERKAINKAISKEVIDYLKDKEITQASAVEAVQFAREQVMKQAAEGAFKTASKEGVTGGAQALTQTIGEEVSDYLTNKDKFKNTPKSTLIDIGKNAILEAAGGGIAGGVFSANPSSSSIYDKVQELNQDTEGLVTFNKEVDAHISAGEITPEQGELVKTKLTNLIEANNSIPKEISDKKLRIEAIDLIQEKNKLKSELDQIDESLAGDRKKAIADIDDMLKHIADGTQKDYQYKLNIDNGKYYQINPNGDEQEITKAAFDIAIKYRRKAKSSIDEGLKEGNTKTQVIDFDKTENPPVKEDEPIIQSDESSQKSSSKENAQADENVGESARKDGNENDERQKEVLKKRAEPVSPVSENLKGKLNKILKTKSDAIQEQKPNKEMLPIGQPEMGLQEVGKGNQEHKETTKQGKEEITPKIVEDAAENESITSKLSGQNNLEQESSIASIESKAESDSQEQRDEAIAEITEKIDQAIGVQSISTSSLNTDEARFQNREKLNEDKVNEIASEWKDADQDPIHVWRDPKDNKLYVLSGHHRLAAAQKAKRPIVKIIDRSNDFNEAEAIKFATEDANANRTMETSIERSKVLRKKRDNGASKDEINKFLEREGKNKVFINNISMLNPKGKTIEMIMRLSDAGDRQTQKISEQIADWIGEARRVVNGLSDYHEEEMFNFLNDKNLSKRITNKSDFIQKVRASVNQIDPTDVLNLARFKNKTQGEQAYDDAVSIKKDELSKIESKIKDITERFVDVKRSDYIDSSRKDYPSVRKVADDKLAELNAIRRKNQKELEDIYREKGRYTGAPTTGDLFSEESVEETEIDKAKDELNKAKAAFRKKSGESLSSGGLHAIPEFVELVQAYIKYGIVTAKDFIKQFRKDFPDADYSDSEISEAFDALKHKTTELITKIKNDATDIIANRKEIRRLSKQAEQGRIRGGIRNVEATILLSTGGKQFGQVKGREAQQQIIEDYAKQEGIWFDDIRHDPKLGSEQEGLGTYKDSGIENQVYVPIDNPSIVRKVMKTTDPFNKKNPNEVLDFLDTRISEHNAGIGSTAPYTVIGFGRLSNGDFVVVTEQPHIQDARLARRDEIKSEMIKMGYEPGGEDSFGDNNHFITDINPKNVLVDKNGNLHFIDTIYDILYDVNEDWVINNKPTESPSKRVKSLATELSQAEGVPSEIQDKIKSSGINGTVFSHLEAKKVAESIIDSEGIDLAVDMAQKNLIKGSVKAFIFGKAIDHYSQKVKDANTQEDRDYWAEKGAEVAGYFEEDSEAYGRFISAIGEYYKSHPDIISRREQNKILKVNEKVVEDSGAKAKIDEVLKEFEKLKAETKEKIAEALDAQVEELNQNLSQEKKKASDKAISALEKFQNKIRSNSYSDATGITAAVDSAITLIIKAIKVGRSVSDAIEIGVAHINKKMNGAKWDEKKFRSDMKNGFENEGVKVENKQKSEQEAILNKYFPKKRTENTAKRKELHEKIIDQYNSGVFEGGVNSDGESFESLFYEKLGLVNPNSKEVQEKIKGFAEKMSKAPSNSIMWRETNQDLLNYLANAAYQTKLRAGADKLSAMWYANILSSPATHLRNLQYNIIQTLFSQPMMLAEKTMLKAGPKAGFSALKNAYIDLFNGLAKGRSEGGRVLTTGRGTRFDKVSEMGITDRGSKTMKFFAAPGRALRASDILFTNGAYETKLGEMAYNMVKDQNPNDSESELSIKKNELLGHTQERLEKAKERTEKELEEFYGPDWKKEKDIDKIQKIREFELMDESMPVEMQEKKEEAKKWAQKGLLTNRPNGIYGDVADLIQKMNKKLWFTQFVMPFVNVPLNVANSIIERSPIGFIKAIRGKEGFGDNATNLTADEKTELMIKAANYSIMIAALAAINGDNDDDELVITGQQTGEYTDNKGIVRGGGLEPYSVYVNGVKILNYKTTPWVSLLMLVGYARDYKLYGENKNVVDAVSNIVTNYLMFNFETSSMMGMAGMFEAISEAKKVSAENIGKSFAKLASGFIPYSGGVKFTSNTINAMLGDADKRPIAWYENVIRDIPFAQRALRTRKDHFGEPMPENFDIPFVPVGERGVVDLTATSPYYKLMKEHDYSPSWSDTKNIYIDGSERKLTAYELDDINIKRGELVKDALNSKNVFIPTNEDDLQSKEASMTTMEYLKGLNNEMFKKRMDELFSEATSVSRIMLYGSKIGITKSDIIKLKDKIKKLPKSEAKKEKTKREESNLKELNSIKKHKAISVQIKEY